MLQHPTASAGLLLSRADIDEVMGTAMTPLDPVTAMSDNRNLLPNLNCLGIWQVAESAIYGPPGPGNWQDMRRQTLRVPNSDRWDSLAVQAVVRYENAETARDFFLQSADRWSECTDHRVNITLNDRPLPSWHSGDLDETDRRLTIPSTRGAGEDIRSCQHVLAVASNVVVDVQACRPQDTPVTEAADIATAIESNVAVAVSGG